MCVIEALAVGRSARSALAGRSGLRGLESAEVAAITHQLNWPQQAYAEAALGEANARRRLWAWLLNRAAALATEEGWPREKGRLSALADVVMEDLLRMDGKESPVRRVAARLGLGKDTYSRGAWPRRYRLLLAEGNDLARSVRELLGREVYDAHRSV